MESQNTFRFLSEYFVLLDDIRDIKIATLNDDWTLILLCEAGRLDIQFASNAMTVRKNDLLFCFPDMIIHEVMVSPDFKCKLLGISEKQTATIFPQSIKIWKQAYLLGQRRKFTLTKEGVREWNIDYEYLKHRIILCDSNYYMDMMYCLIQSIIYRVSGIMEHSLETLDDKEDTIQSKDLIFKSFFELLFTTSPKPRAVSWYAEKLYKTPKYLSSVVKQTSGRTPSEWIQEAVMAEIVNLLKNSNKSVKEICAELDFPNLSFFGRYVRTHLGVSPNEYRRQKANLPNVPDVTSD